MKIALRYNRPVTSGFVMGLSKPLCRVSTKTVMTFQDSYEIPETQEYIERITELHVNAQELHVDLMPENFDLIREWTAKGEDGRSMWSFASAQDADVFEREVASLAKPKAKKKADAPAEAEGVAEAPAESAAE